MRWSTDDRLNNELTQKLASLNALTSDEARAEAVKSLVADELQLPRLTHLGFLRWLQDLAKASRGQWVPQQVESPSVSVPRKDAAKQRLEDCLILAFNTAEAKRIPVTMAGRKDGFYLPYFINLHSNEGPAQATVKAAVLEVWHHAWASTNQGNEARAVEHDHGHLLRPLPLWKPGCKDLQPFWLESATPNHKASMTRIGVNCLCHLPQGPVASGWFLSGSTAWVVKDHKPRVLPFGASIMEALCHYVHFGDRVEAND